MKTVCKKKEDYTVITAANSAGMEMTLTSLGAGIREIKLPDKTGKSVTVTLCPTDDGSYRAAYYGKTIGRTAGRIENATFEIDGRKAELEKNNKGCDNLHGGKTGFHSVVFAHETVESAEYTDVIFKYTSPDGEGGYFGKVDMKVTYRVYERENTFRIIFDGESDSKTLLNPTNHVYLNMSGNLAESAKEQKLYINASHFGLLDERLIIRKILPMTEEMDFRTPHKIGDYVYHENVQRYTFGYDHQYFLDTRGLDDLACSLESDVSGIKLEMRTTFPCVVFYANSCPDPGQEVYPGKKDEQYLSACLECQYHPDGIHACPDNCGVISPGHPLHEVVEYKFTCRK